MNEIMPSGAHSSVPRFAPWKDSGMTPTTDAVRAFTSSVRPTTAGSPPNRRCQSPWDSTTTG